MAEEVSVKETRMKMGGGESEITLKVTENSYFFLENSRKRKWKFSGNILLKVYQLKVSQHKYFPSFLQFCL